jgi:TolA-binding protein
MQPIQAKSPQEKPRIHHILTHLVHRGRYALWTILILIAVFLVVYFAWTQWNTKRAADSTLAAEAVQDQYDKWNSESNADKKATLEKALMDGVDQLVARYPRHYGGERGLYIRANVFFADKSWEKAAGDYQELAKRFPQSYLAPISLFEAGVCLEQKGDKAGAQALYMRVTDGYKDSAAAPRALFDAARLDEDKGAFEDAQKKYDTLGTSFASSQWTTLAKNRIIALKVAGKIK